MLSTKDSCDEASRKVAEDGRQKGRHHQHPYAGSWSGKRKVEETQVTLVADTSGNKQVLIDQHWEYSRLIEDITSVQALTSMRKFYTQDAGYALATQGRR